MKSNPTSKVFLLVIHSLSQNSDCSFRHQIFGATNFPSVNQKKLKHSFLTPSYANFERNDGNIFEPRLEETKHHKTKKDTYPER